MGLLHSNRRAVYRLVILYFSLNTNFQLEAKTKTLKHQFQINISILSETTLNKKLCCLQL